MSKKRIALVNQRYGLEVNGGSEYYTRLIAEKLSEKYEVEVLTTRALNYDTWENYYEEGLQEVNGIKVRRFSVLRKRNVKLFLLLNKLLRSLRNRFLENLWINMQGPLSKDLISYIRNHKNNYDVFIFVTYLYYSTVKGLPEVADKAIFIPTAHDEQYIYFKAYKKLFTLPKGIIYLTEEEQRFVHTTFHNEHVRNEVIGVGIDIPEITDVSSFRDKYNLNEPYLIYAGRIEVDKGCDTLFQYFMEYKHNHPTSEIKLVLIGKDYMNIPTHKDILYLGFVSEENKWKGIAGARALVMPSQHESLSISVLEAMALATPVLVNKACEILRGHVDKSKGGLHYTDYKEFEVSVNELLKNSMNYEDMKRNAKAYVKLNYQWGTIMNKIDRML